MRPGAIRVHLFFHTNEQTNEQTLRNYELKILFARFQIPKKEEFEELLSGVAGAEPKGLKLIPGRVLVNQGDVKLNGFSSKNCYQVTQPRQCGNFGLCIC